jgi:hypothetical protein
MSQFAHANWVRHGRRSALSHVPRTVGIRAGIPGGMAGVAVLPTHLEAPHQCKAPLPGTWQNKGDLSNQTFRKDNMRREPTRKSQHQRQVWRETSLDVEDCAGFNSNVVAVETHLNPPVKYPPVFVKKLTKLS